VFTLTTGHQIGFDPRQHAIHHSACIGPVNLGKGGLKTGGRAYTFPFRLDGPRVSGTSMTVFF
jgi:hypothetical protein